MSFRVAWLDGPGGPAGIEEAELTPVRATLVRAAGASPGDVLAAVAEADAILCDATAITGDLLDRAPRVQVVSEYGIGYDNIDVGAASQRGIWVANVPGFCAPEVADHALALVLAANRRVIALDRSVRDGGWDVIGAAGDIRRLSEQTLGLIGFGQIGRRVASRAAAFGMRVLAFSPHLTPELARQHGAERAELDDLVARSDYVSLHLPVTAATRGLVDAALLAHFRPGAWLINTSRGALVDEAALLDALRSGRLGGAALDVRRQEPPPADDPFRALPNVILTPHAGYYSRESLVELRRRAARNVAAVLAGGRPDHPVNPDLVLKRERRDGGNGLWV